VSSYSFESFISEPLLFIPFNVSSYSFDSFEEIHWLLSHNHTWSSCFVETMLPSNSLCCNMFKGSQPLHFHPCVSSPSFDPSLFINILICFMIHHGPPSMILFPSTSTHYLRVRIRNHSVPWSMHASMAGFLAFDNRF
jgi:hypothetical protein